MLTNYHAKKVLKNSIDENIHQKSPMDLLTEAINGALYENTQRVYINDISHLADFKLPAGINLKDIENAVNNEQLKFLEAKIIGNEIFVHCFQLFPSMKTIEIWYKPLSRPRI